MRIGQLVAVPLMFAITTFAFGAPIQPVPEPDALALIGIGAIALVVVRWRNNK